MPRNRPNLPHRNHLSQLDLQVIKAFEASSTAGSGGKGKGELVMDVELLDVFDDEADQGYYEDATPTLEQLEEIMAETGRFTGGGGFEKLPGQMAVPKQGPDGSGGPAVTAKPAGPGLEI